MQVKEVIRYGVKRRAFSLPCKQEDAPLLDMIRQVYPQERAAGFLLQNTQDTSFDKSLMRIKDGYLYPVLSSIHGYFTVLKTDWLKHV